MADRVQKRGTMASRTTWSAVEEGLRQWSSSSTHGRSVQRRLPCWRLTATRTLPEAALLYARHGWAVFGLQARMKTPYRGTRGFRDATCNAEVIRRIWQRLPESNIGLAPGQSGLLVYDIDSRCAEDIASRLGLFDQATLTIKTGRSEFADARHIYFQHPGNGLHIGNRRIGGILEVKADGGFVVLPPSVHPSGAIYTFADCSEPVHLPAEALAALHAVSDVRPGIRPRDVPRLSLIPESSRHNSLLSAITRLVALTHGRMEAQEIFGWVQALNEARCSPSPVSRKEVWAMVQWAYGRENGAGAGQESLAIRLGVPPTTSHACRASLPV